MIPNELIDFLRQLSVGQLEVVYENLTCTKECISVPPPPSLMTADYLVLLLCTFPYLELLDELLKYETSDGITLHSELANLYQKCLCMESQEQLLRTLLRKHHSFGHRMNLFEQHATTIDWMEEPFERLVGVLAYNNVGFLMEVDRTWSIERPMIVVRASDTLATRWVKLFGEVAYNKYPTQFETEYCQYTYQTGHYDHPLQLLFERYTPSIKEQREAWNQALQNLCSMDAETQITGRNQLLSVIKDSSSVQQKLLFLTQRNPSAVDIPTNFELELCSRHSMVSMLWLYTYLNLNPQDLPNASPGISLNDYNRLMTPIRELFDPIWDCVLDSVEEPSDSELLPE